MVLPSGAKVTFSAVPATSAAAMRISGLMSRRAIQALAIAGRPRLSIPGIVPEPDGMEPLPSHSRLKRQKPRPRLRVVTLLPSRSSFRAQRTGDSLRRKSYKLKLGVYDLRYHFPNDRFELRQSSSGMDPRLRSGGAGWQLHGRGKGNWVDTIGDQPAHRPSRTPPRHKAFRPTGTLRRPDGGRGSLAAACAHRTRKPARKLRSALRRSPQPDDDLGQRLDHRSLDRAASWTPDGRHRRAESPSATMVLSSDTAHDDDTIRIRYGTGDWPQAYKLPLYAEVMATCGGARASQLRRPHGETCPASRFPARARAGRNGAR